MFPTLLQNQTFTRKLVSTMFIPSAEKEVYVGMMQRICAVNTSQNPIARKQKLAMTLMFNTADQETELLLT
jgi:hypothetical protein